MNATRLPNNSSQQYLKNASSSINNSIHNFLSTDHFEHELAIWAADGSSDQLSLPVFQSFDSLSGSEASQDLPGPYLSSFYNAFLNPNLNPALSRPIFSHALPTGAIESAEEDLLPWPPGEPETFVQTIEPQATFQPILTSPSRHTDEMPLHMISHGRSSLVLTSSPMSNSSPGILRSQPELDNSPRFTASTLELSPDHLSKVRRATSRLTRRRYSRKVAPSTASQLRNARIQSKKSGMDCGAIIALNEFACGYKGCDKRFKRQEHKKRHEKTVHEKDDHNQYKCWVQECKTAPFSRTDNLKSHLQKTHGKRSASARSNRYVATQDKNSEYYDPDWVGELTDEGYPVSWPLHS